MSSCSDRPVPPEAQLESCLRQETLAHVLRGWYKNTSMSCTCTGVTPFPVAYYAPLSWTGVQDPGLFQGGQSEFVRRLLVSLRPRLPSAARLYPRSSRRTNFLYTCTTTFVLLNLILIFVFLQEICANRETMDVGEYLYTVAIFYQFINCVERGLYESIV